MSSFLGTLIVTFVALAAAILLMAAGLLLGNRRIRGGCGSTDDCDCGSARSRNASNQINGSVSK